MAPLEPGRERARPDRAKQLEAERCPRGLRQARRQPAQVWNDHAGRDESVFTRFCRRCVEAIAKAKARGKAPEEVRKIKIGSLAGIVQEVAQARMKK